MSGSKIRLLIANEQYDEVRKNYTGLLNEPGLQFLIHNVRRGLRMTLPTPVTPPSAAAEETSGGSRYTKRRKFRKRKLKSRH